MTNGLPGDSLAETKLQETTPPRRDRPSQGRPATADCTGQTLGDVYVAARPGNVDLAPPRRAPPPAPDHRAGHMAMALPDDVTPTLDRLDLNSAWMEVWPASKCAASIEP